MRPSRFRTRQVVKHKPLLKLKSADGGLARWEVGQADWDQAKAEAEDRAELIIKAGLGGHSAVGDYTQARGIHKPSLNLTKRYASWSIAAERAICKAVAAQVEEPLPKPSRFYGRGVMPKLELRTLASKLTSTH